MTRYAMTLLLAVTATALELAPSTAAERKRAAATIAESGHLVRHAPGAHAASGRHGRRRELAWQRRPREHRFAMGAGGPMRNVELVARDPRRKAR
jgi:hypothetical protein